MEQPLGFGVDDHQRNLAVGCHLLAFLGWLFPFGHIIGPLVLWLVKREGNAFVDDQGKEAVNFQISVSLWFVIIGAVAAVTVWTVVIPVLALLAALVLGLVWLVSVILAAVRASRGQAYRYPWTLRLLR